jgi:hypothetical protein
MVIQNECLGWDVVAMKFDGVSLIVGPKILFLFDLLYSSVAGDKNKL